MGSYLWLKWNLSASTLSHGAAVYLVIKVNSCEHKNDPLGVYIS